MAMRDVKELIESLEGLPDGLLLGKRAKDLTIGDLRLVYRYAMLMGGGYLEQDRHSRIGDSSRANPRDD